MNQFKTEETKRQVPGLSLKDFTDGTQSEKTQFVDEFMLGLKEYGFIVLKDHGVKDQLIQEAYTHLKTFFALPLKTKQKYAGQGGGQRGHTAFGVEHAKDNKNPDLKEFWHVGRELTNSSVYKGIYPENIWPEEITHFKQAFLTLYESMDQVSNTLLSAIGLGLDLPGNYFSDMIHDGNSILRAIHYPSTQGQDTASSIRAAAHEDINLITLLVGATDSGLELLDRDGNWLPVKSGPGEIVVDSGDMLSRITNDLLPATTHRVVNPVNDKSTRYSMPYFVHPHSKATLSCIPSCVGSGAKYEDISSGEFLIQRLKEIGLY